VDPGIGAKEVRPEAVVQVGAVRKRGGLRKKKLLLPAGMYFPHKTLHILSSRIDGLKIGRHVFVDQL
jgi:hypothetical protein